MGEHVELAGVEGLEHLSGADEATKGEWIQGLAVNPASGDAVLSRILMLNPLPGNSYWDWPAWRELPRKAAETAARHPDPRIRKMILENPSLPADVVLTLASDADSSVRRVCVVTALERGIELPHAVLAALATDPHQRTKYWVGAHPNLSMELRRQLLDDPDPEARAGALNLEIWGELTPERRAELAAEEHHWIRGRVRDFTTPHRPLPLTLPEYLQEDNEVRRQAAARDAGIDRDLADHLLDSSVAWERLAAVENPSVTVEMALRLADDPDAHVRLRLSLREDLPEERRRDISYVVEGIRYYPEKWVTDRHDDPEAMRRAAASSHVLIRRSVARARRLPLDVVEALANDEDFFVRLALCESCDDAPHELLLEMYAYWHGLSWGSLAARPNFARPGLARFADHPNPRLKQIALRDPEASPELVARLVDDPAVRSWAARDPRLPYPILLGLLSESGQPRNAAMNPALTPEHMRGLLDLAGAPECAPDAMDGPDRNPIIPMED
jgi:hypothetical protein